jgi:apolipoprotein N-acyltransferase
MVDTAGAALDAPTPATRDEAGRPLPLWAAGVAAAVAGGALLAAFPPYDQWWLAPVGVALLSAAAHRRRLGSGALLGLLAGLVFFLPLLAWTSLHLDALPWLLLSGLEAAYIALLGLLLALASPLIDRWRWAWPVVTALFWVGQEALRDRTPFGGFPWGRLAFSQGDSPMLRLAALGGAPLVTAGVGLVGGLLVAAGWRTWRGPSAVRLRGLAAAAGAGAVVAGGLLVPVAGSPGAGRVTVAIVQGNVPRLGFDFNAQRRAVLDNHVSATLALAQRVAAGSERRPDLVVWPENASDIDPLRNTDAAAAISATADAIDAPILVGAVLRGPAEGQVRNVGLLWRPGSGPDQDQMYVKRHPVPFAEYVPLRDIARRVSAEVDRIQSDFVSGTRPGVLQTGPVVVGDVICFEIAYDEVVRDTVTSGAEVLVVQTNNATFDEAEARQQLAMVRLRAVEHGRGGLMASTVGVSGFVGTDGRVTGATGFNTAEVVVRDMTPATRRTVATRLGLWPEVVLVALAVAVLTGAVWQRRRRTRRSEDAEAA